MWAQRGECLMIRGGLMLCQFIKRETGVGRKTIGQ